MAAFPQEVCQVVGRAPASHPADPWSAEMRDPCPYCAVCHRIFDQVSRCGLVIVTGPADRRVGKLPRRNMPDISEEQVVTFIGPEGVALPCGLSAFEPKLLKLKPGSVRLREAPRRKHAGVALENFWLHRPNLGEPPD